MATKNTRFKTTTGAMKALKSLGIDVPVFKSGQKEGLPKISLEQMQALYDEYYANEEAAAAELLAKANESEQSNAPVESVSTDEVKAEEVVVVKSKKKKEPIKSAPVFHRPIVRVHPMTFRKY